MNWSKLREKDTFRSIRAKNISAGIHVYGLELQFVVEIVMAYVYEIMWINRGKGICVVDTLCSAVCDWEGKLELLY